MDKVRIKNDDIYRVEVNDNGDYIEFDLADIGLPYRAKESIEMVNKYMEELRNKEVNIENADELFNLEQDMFKKMRECMDNFLGKGACQKIFGDRNYYWMYDELIEAFEEPQEELGGLSILDKLDLTSNGIKNRIANKYQKNSNDVL